MSTDTFYDSSYTLCKSIISQRLILLRFGKSKISNEVVVKMTTEELSSEFEKYKNCSRTLAYFIRKHYENLLLIIPHSNGFEHRIECLKELYQQSLQIS